MRRIAAAVLGAVTLIGTFVVAAPRAEAAGIVTHAWMALDAIDQVHPAGLRAVLDAHRDQVRAGAEFPDGGYWTRSIGTPGGDYGEEAHWQRFVEAYVAQVRADPACRRLADPNGPCAATIAHLMGAAAHGMGDEVWDWLFEPNGPGQRESYLPADLAAFIGPGGLEAQMDLEAIVRHGRPTTETPALPDTAKVMAAFRAIGRTDISADALPIGDGGLDVERGVEALWAPTHIDALERAMPWTTSHMVTSAGGVDFAARAIARYYEWIWARLQGRLARTRVGATAPYNGQVNVPATGWTGSYSPGSNDGNSGGLTRIAASLSSALPFNMAANQGPVTSQLPADALRLRDLQTGELVTPRAGYPRVVPYNPEAGEHVVAFQPAADLAPCRWYQAETTKALVDGHGSWVQPAHWKFRTSGCAPRRGTAPAVGTVVCDAAGGYRMPDGAAPATDVMAFVRLSNCAGGVDGSRAQVATGIAFVHVHQAQVTCGTLQQPTSPQTAEALVRWDDATGQAIGITAVGMQPFDSRGATLTTSASGTAFPAHAIALRLPPDATGCGDIAPISAGRVTVWPA